MEFENPFDEGIRALEAGRHELALGFFSKAVNEKNTPLVCSYLAYCRAKTSGSYREAVDICMNARREEPKNSEIYLNLGRIYLLAGNRKQAIQVFRLGLRHQRNSRIINELSSLGNRKSPPVPFLLRSHPVNKYLGLIMTRLGLR